MARLPLLPAGSIVVSVLALASPPSASAGEVSLVPDQFCDVRWALVTPGPYGVTKYRTAYRTTIAVPPATGRLRTG